VSFQLSSRPYLLSEEYPDFYIWLIIVVCTPHFCFDTSQRVKWFGALESFLIFDNGDLPIIDSPANVTYVPFSPDSYFDHSLTYSYKTAPPSCSPHSPPSGMIPEVSHLECKIAAPPFFFHLPYWWILCMTRKTFSRLLALCP